MIAHLRQWLSAGALALVATSVAASFHTFAIEAVYSNADGTVQFIVMHETIGAAGANVWSGHALTSTHVGVTKTFPFGTDLPSAATAGKRVLIGTAGLAALGFITPDYVMPDGFLATDGVVIDYAGVDQVTFASLPTDGVNGVGRSGAPIPNLATNFAGAAVALPALSVAAIEYYNASLDHYFISNLQPDIDALDSGRTAGWVRTGQSLRVYPSQTSGGPGVNPVCRFYIPPQHGNSHFFSASPAECAVIQQKAATDANYSGYVFESPSVFYIALPDTATGACPDGTVSVYRLWNQRPDSNHRYTSDPAVKIQMVAKSYVAEGYGPNAVIMCAPVPGVATLQFNAGSSAPEGALVNDGLSAALWQTAAQIYADERTGLNLNAIEIVDATANPKAATWNAFTCGPGNASVAALQADIGARPGRSNVYLVGLVDGVTSRGNACTIGGSFVAIAAGSGAELLAHELGHDFGLEHIDDLTADFDVSNVMHSASNTRRYFTEGQTFRANLRPYSAINSVYNARPGLPVRDCDRDTITRDCPLIKKRLWNDGAFLAN